MSNEAIRERLARLQEDGEVLSGPWSRSPNDFDIDIYSSVGQRLCANVYWKNVGDFLANAITDIPDLLAQVDELTDEVSRLRADQPKAYTPWEEVTEGWYTARHNAGGSRYMVRVDGKRKAYTTWTQPAYLLDAFTDFLPIPAYLIDGIESEVRE